MLISSLVAESVVVNDPLLQVTADCNTRVTTVYLPQVAINQPSPHGRLNRWVGCMSSSPSLQDQWIPNYVGPLTTTTQLITFVFIGISIWIENVVHPSRLLKYFLSYPSLLPSNNTGTLNTKTLNNAADLFSREYLQTLASVFICNL